MVFASIVNMNYTLCDDDMRFSIEFTSQIFANKEPTSVALGVTSDEFTDVFRSIMEKSVLSGYSHASHSECGDAVALNIPYDQFIDVEYNVSSKIEPMFALFDMLKYVPSGKCLYIFSIASDARGLASQLLQYTIDEAKAHGFTSIMADCTNIKSQNLFAKFGFVVRSEITYGGFEHKSVYSFKNVNNTKSIQKMELML
jgi:GNAT superfamily N-acetyltransferase